MSRNLQKTVPSKGSVMLASLLLPGMAALVMGAPTTANAESPPEKTTIGLKYGVYNEWQSDLDRISVKVPQIYFLAPVAGDWSVEALGATDSVSGATPRLYTQRSSASVMSDERKAGDVTVTRYFSRAAVSASLAYSDEHDYTSKALGLQARWSSEDNNRTWTVGMGFARDRIDNQASGVNTAINERKRTNDFMVGVTQVLTKADIVQFNLTRALGSGYFNDPYKSFDERPDTRNTWIALGRWNHHVASIDSSVRSSYRYYRDTFGVRSHTLGLELVKPFGRWTLTPGLRYYTQSAAHFYLDPVFDASGQYDATQTLIRNATRSGPKSGDQRLSAFGAVTLSIKVEYEIQPDTVVDLKLEEYRQESSMRLGGGGSPGLDPMRARFIQVGFNHKF